MDLIFIFLIISALMGVVRAINAIVHDQKKRKQRSLEIEDFERRHPAED